jgi:prepilin-type N-terminal cleavage/methylation domain-containing protein/prepilin-type processing-associated H-X9-DG protein
MKIRGFTLIELLVVIAIIAILAAILFPVFAQAKAAAKKTADLSNFKQIATGLLLYGNDNDDLSMVSDHEADLEWYEAMYPYLKSQDVFRTPAYTRAAVVDEHSGESVLPGSDYSINGIYTHGTSLTHSSSPAEQITIALRDPLNSEIDYHAWPHENEHWDDIEEYQTEIDGRLRWFEGHLAETPWNGRGSNFSFLDGHAKFTAFERTVREPLPGMHNIDRLWFLIEEDED